MKNIDELGHGKIKQFRFSKDYLYIHTANYHIKEIYKSGELGELATARKFRVVQKEGNRDVSRNVIIYNLDVIIAVGYRVNSKRATQFRILC